MRKITVNIIWTIFSAASIFSAAAAETFTVESNTPIQWRSAANGAANGAADFGTWDGSDYSSLIQAEWQREDRIDGTAAGYFAAAKKHFEAATALLDLRADDLPAERIEAERMALAALEAKRSALERSAPENAAEAEQIYAKIRGVKRRIVFAHPLLNFDRLLFCKRVPGNYSHLVQQYFGWRARRGGGLFVLENFGKSLETRSILPDRFSHGSTLEPRLSWDGKKVVFSWVDCPDAPYEATDVWPTDPPERGFYHLFTVNVDGSDLRQITNDSFDDIMPNWLADGHLIFCSTRRLSNGRCHWWGIGHRWNTYTLHRADADGSNIKTLSWNDTNEWFPTVDETGLIYYSRWDYIDRDAVTHQNCWSMRPDGTNPRAVWGNATPAPLCTFQIHPIPETGKFVFIASAHHAITGGPLVMLDPNAGVDGEQALTNLTPEIHYPEYNRSNETIGIPEYYESPEPLSEDCFLVSYSPVQLTSEGSSAPPNALGIYLLDSDGNREIVYRDSAISSMNAVVLRARNVPPVIPSQLPPNAPNDGEMAVTDVYEGLGDGISKGDLEAIRIVQIFPKTTRDYPPIGFAGEENGRAILGTVPIEADGSAYFRVPAQKAILFQLLDKKGQAYQTMRSLTYLQSGETISCTGCHEDRRSAGYKPIADGPNTKRPLAMRRASSEIDPGELGGRPFSYVETIQPIWDAKCVECHNAQRTEGGMNLTGETLPPDKVTGMKKFVEGCFNVVDERADSFTQSYWALCGGIIFYDDDGRDPSRAANAWVPRFGGRNTIQITEPGGRYGAIGARLLKYLDAGHEGVTLSDGERRNIAAWIDLNAIFYGVYEPDAQAAQLRGQRIAMPKIQ